MKLRQHSGRGAEPAAISGHAAVDPLHASPRQLAQRERIQSSFGPAAPLQAEPEPEPHRTGLPDHLKAGIESLSGMDMSGVRVHRNSDQPAQLNALAYAQGNDIHLGPGQEQHLPHEAWHVVQQAQGRVAPTMQLQGHVNVNDDEGLEREADQMGSQAAAGEVVQREVKKSTAPWGASKGKWYSTHAPTEYFDTEALAIARDQQLAAQLQQQQAQQALAAPQQAEQAWQAAADVQGWDIVASAGNHYADGWGQAYGITNDDDLCVFIENHVYDHGENEGENRIEMGKRQANHQSENCRVVYEMSTITVTVGAITRDVPHRRVFHCGPTTQG